MPIQTAHVCSLPAPLSPCSIFPQPPKPAIGAVRSTPPVWAFHGDNDGVIHCTESIRLVDQINEWGITPA